MKDYAIPLYKTKEQTIVHGTRPTHRLKCKDRTRSCSQEKKEKILKKNLFSQTY